MLVPMNGPCIGGLTAKLSATAPLQIILTSWCRVTLQLLTCRNVWHLLAAAAPFPVLRCLDVQQGERGSCKHADTRLANVQVHMMSRC